MFSAPTASGPDSARRPQLSVVVVSCNMRREIPRTLYSLSSRYQKNVGRDDYEIILVDNGSEFPWEPPDLAHIEADLRIINLREAAGPSPCGAINAGLAQARGRLIGVIMDGARMVTPGLLDACRRAACLDPRPVIAAADFDLGSDLQVFTARRGYTQAVEDRLLESIHWPQDGYRLFEISSPGRAAGRVWFDPIVESNALFMPAELWVEMGGYDERFESPGGGLVNMDTYARALALSGVQPVMLVGEASFHQMHGDVATNSPNPPVDAWREEYRRIRGQDWSPPSVSPVLFGEVPSSAFHHIEDSGHAARASSFWGDVAIDYVALLKRAILAETSLNFRVSAGGTAAINRKRIDNLHRCVETVLRRHVPGDFVDCGPWEDGAGVLMCGILKASVPCHRIVWMTDPHLADSLDRAKAFFAFFGLLDEEVRFVNSPEVERIAILRLDGQAKGSLSTLYSKLSTGGFVIIDDYGADGLTTECGRAVEEFRTAHGFTTPLERIDESAVLWQKQEYSV